MLITVQFYFTMIVYEHRTCSHWKRLEKELNLVHRIEWEPRVIFGIPNNHQTFFSVFNISFVPRHIFAQTYANDHHW